MSFCFTVTCTPTFSRSFIQTDGKWSDKNTNRTDQVNPGLRQTREMRRERYPPVSMKKCDSLHSTCGKLTNVPGSQAFAPKSGRRADRQARRTVERDQTRLHVPLVNRTPDEDPPPVIVAIVGPPGVGKTTLLKSLVRRFTKQTLNHAQGPITVVSGKRRRLTFVECNNDLNSMIDIGKVADLVLLLVDASFGFEMVRVSIVLTILA